MRILLLSLVFLLVTSVLPAQEAIGKTAVFSWDAVTTDVAGGPETIAIYELAAFPAGTVLNPTTGTAPVPIAKYSVSGTILTCAGSNFLLTIPNGTRILFSIRCYDIAGNVSDWSDPLDLVLDFQKPKKPNKPWWKFW